MSAVIRQREKMRRWAWLVSQGAYESPYEYAVQSKILARLSVGEATFQTADSPPRAWDTEGEK